MFKLIFTSCHCCGTYGMFELKIKDRNTIKVTNSIGKEILSKILCFECIRKLKR